MSLNVSKQWSALLFAAEFDCQFKDDLISATDADEGISKLPTPLIPIGGIPHLDHWLQSFQSAGITSVFVICSSQCYPHLIEWSTTRGFPASNILRGGYPRGDGSATCTNFEQSLAVALNRNLLVVSGNTLLLESFNLTKVLYEFSEERNFSFFSSVDDRLQPHAFVGDDSSVIDISSSNSEVQGLPALYFYSCRAASSVVDFFKTSQYSLVQQSVATPYAIMKWLIERGTDVEILKVDGIMLIDSIGAYKIADSAFSKSLEQRVNILPHTVTQHCSARVGLMGNPSDGFGGKTLSFLIKNFTAQVTITQNSSCSSSSSRYNSVTIIPHPIFDPSTFSNMGQLQLHTNNKVSQM